MRTQADVHQLIIEPAWLLPKVSKQQIAVLLSIRTRGSLKSIVDQQIEPTTAVPCNLLKCDCS